MEGSDLILENSLDIAHSYELSQVKAEAIRTQATPKAMEALKISNLLEHLYTALTAYAGDQSYSAWKNKFNMCTL